MKRYLSLYKQLCIINLSAFFEYRSNVINQLIATTVWTILVISTMVILTEKAKYVAGWTQAEMLLLTGAILTCLGIFEINFKRSFQQLPDTIYFGNLDELLLKPIDSQFIISFIQFNIFGLWRCLIGILFMTYIILKFQIIVTAFSIFGFALFLVVGSLTYYSIWFILSTLLFWFPRLSNILDVANSLNHTSRFPPEMYREFNIFIYLFVLPYMFIVATPVHVLMQRASFYDISGLLLSSTILFIFSRIFWKHALRYYTSASS